MDISKLMVIQASTWPHALDIYLEFIHQLLLTDIFTLMCKSKISDISFTTEFHTIFKALDIKLSLEQLTELTILTL
jgi:hypothetical protein